jgi:hypothetical protein
VERLERKAGLRVDRVMVPPHGACSAEMLAALPRCGFEAACVSSGSLRAHNRERPWARTLGYLPSDTIEDCSVLPRWALTPGAENALLVAAYLGQAIVLRGHHRDLRHGLEVLDEAAAAINRLGEVRWSGLAQIARGNYRWRLEGTTLRVQAFGSVLDVEPRPAWRSTGPATATTAAGSCASPTTASRTRCRVKRCRCGSAARCISSA